MALSTGARSNIYSEVLRAWKIARHRLDTAAKEYADACVALGVVCSRHPTHDVTKSMLEEVLVALDLELPNLTPSPEQAANANKVVKVLRNRSTSLVSINILPSELLVRIFELLSHSRVNAGTMDGITMYPEALLRVSTSWRQTALDNQQLWTCIILAQSTAQWYKAFNQARARLERAHSSLLDFHVNGRRAWCFVPTTMELLARVAPRLGSISWEATREYDAVFLRESLPVLIELSIPGSVYALRLLGHGPYQFVADPADFRSMEKVEEFLASIQYLALHNVFIDLSSTAYHGLVELDLSFNASFFQFPTVDEFTSILLASPGLRALKLHDFGLQPSSSPDAVTPVHLDNLDILFLGNIQRRSLKLLLPLIQPGSRPLYMRFQLPKRGKYFIHYTQFLRRSYVVKLMVEGIGGYPSQPLLASLAHVQHLLLVDFLIDSLFLRLMAEPLIPYAKEQYPSAWPHLQNLHLTKCVFMDTKAYGAFTMLVPYDFRLWIWNVKALHGLDDLPINPNSPEGQSRLGLLASYIPGMQDIESDKTLLSCAWGSALDFSNYNS